MKEKAARSAVVYLLGKRILRRKKEQNKDAKKFVGGAALTWIAYRLLGGKKLPAEGVKKRKSSGASAAAGILGARTASSGRTKPKRSILRFAGRTLGKAAVHELNRPLRGKKKRK